MPLAAVDSAPLAAIVHWMDRVSDNFVAEMLVKQLGAVQAGAGHDRAPASASITGLLAQAGVPLDGVRLVDGSGLSLLDRLTPNALVALLSAMWRTPRSASSARVAAGRGAQTGTLADRMRARRCNRRRAREDRHDHERLRPLGLRRRPLRLLRAAERLARVVDWARIAQDRFAAVLARGRVARASRSSSVGRAPGFSAFVSFDLPGSSPTISPVVFVDTELATFAPSASSAACASSRVSARACL